jgi:low temperature requirement protein LtrA
MRASDDSALPPRSGWRRLIRPWEYRHLHAVANLRFASGGFQLGVGLCVLGLARKAETDQDRRKMYRLSAWFLVPGALNLIGGCLDTIAARTAPPRA